MPLNAYKIQGFRGGIADDAYKGVKGSFRFGYGLDIRSGGDTLKCNQALEKDSADIVTDLILFFVPATNGKLYGFGDSGKIYCKDTPASAWELKYTDANGKITGAGEYTNNDGATNYISYLYWATETKVSRIPLAGTWATDVEHNWGNLNGDVSWHTMRIAVGVLMICDGRYIAMVDYEGNFNNQALDIIPSNRAKCLLDIDQLAVIGSTKGDKVEEGWLWTWDKIEPSWIQKRMIAEKGINAMLDAEFVIIQAGVNGGLYFWDMASLLRIKQLPGGGWVNPQGIANMKGLPILGLIGSDKCGVYSYGRLNKNDPYALNLEYIPSHGKIIDVKIGAMVMYSDKPYISWKDGTDYGVDTIDEDNKAEARYEGLVFDADEPFVQKGFRHIKLLTKSLPKNCSIEVYYRLNEQESWKKATMQDGAEQFDKEGMTKAVFTIETGDEEGEEKGKGEEYEIALNLHPAGNETPEVIAIANYFESLGIL